MGPASFRADLSHRGSSNGGRGLTPMSMPIENGASGAEVVSIDGRNIGPVFARQRHPSPIQVPVRRFLHCLTQRLS